MENGRAGEVNGAAQASADGTVGEVRKRESDILYALVLLFTYGQLGLIVWDMLVMVPGFAGLVAMAGIQNPGRMHPFAEMTTMYLGLVGGYIGWNAYQKIKGREDTEGVPRHLFMRIQRGQFYMALWGTVCFIAYMLKGAGVISRLPQELTITTLGVLGGLVGDKAIKRFLDRRTVSQLEVADAEASHSDRIMEYATRTGRINNKECRELTGLKDAWAANLLTRLKKEGKLKQMGNGKNTYYVIA